MSARKKTPLAAENIEPAMCDIDLRLKILRQLPFFADLQASEVAEVNTLFHERGFAAGEIIYSAGSSAGELYVVAAGKVKLIRHTFSGQDVILDILTRGEFFGSLSALGDDEYPDTAQAQTVCCILGITSENFQVVLRHYPSVALALLGIVAERLRGAREEIQHLHASSVESRIAATLLKLAEKVGQEQQSGIMIQMPLSRQDLADMTGATVESVSRIMSQFQKDKLIRSGRRWVAITDRSRLSTIASAEM